MRWEIKTSEGKTYSYEAILLDNINVYNKNDDGPNYFVAADKITLVYTQCLIDGTPQSAGQRHLGTLVSIYRDLVAYINKSGTAIVEADVLKVFKNESGATLESLK